MNLDYYPFGMVMPNRSFTSNDGGYRFGFNGMEKDDEVSGEGNSLDFGARIYSSRLGKWLSTDEFFNLYPDQTVYGFSLNSPVLMKDIDGNVVAVYDDNGNLVATISKSGTVIAQGQEKNEFLMAYKASKMYIEKENASDMFTIMENRSETVHMVPLQNNIEHFQELNKKGPSFSVIDDNSGLLLWDPYLGLETKTGNNSPASVLTHEFGHAESHFDNPELHKEAALNTFDEVTEETYIYGGIELKLKIADERKKFTNQEELETIAKTNLIMQKINKRVGTQKENENRDSHSGKLYPTISPTSTFPDLTKLPKPIPSEPIIQRDNTRLESF